jgi:MFS family permease
MDNAGAVVGPLLATAFVALGLSVPSIFWIAVVPGAIATALVALVREPAPARKPKAASGKASGQDSRPLFTPPFALYLAILTVFSLGNSSDAFLLLRASTLGLTTAEIPVLWAVLNASKVLWAYLGGSAADRIPPARLIVGGWIVYAAVYLGLGRATASWQVWALFIVYGVFYGLTEPVEKALVRELVPPEQRGRGYGAYNFVVGVTALPAGVITGAAWKAWGPEVSLELGAVLAGAAGVLLLGWDGWRRRQAD